LESLLRKYHNIEVLDLKFCQGKLTRLSVFPCLKLSSCLVEINLRGVFLDDKALGGLEVMTQLQKINISRKSKVQAMEISSKALTSFFDKMKQLVSVNLSWNLNVTDDCIGVIASRACDLEVISLECCKQLTNQTLQFLSGLKMKSISMLGCPKISSIGLLTIKNCASLRELDFSHCPLLTNTDLQSICSLPNLEKISVRHCPQISVIVELQTHYMIPGKIVFDSS